MIIFAYVESGQYAKAISHIEQWRHVESNPWSWGLEAYVYGRSGNRAKTRHALEKMEEAKRQQHMDPAIMSSAAYLAMGENDKVLASLEEAYSARSNALTTLKVDPIYDSVRSEPRFQALMRQVGLAQ